MKQYTKNYQGFEVRCVEDEDNVIWFVAKDILEAVGIKVTNSITKYISHIPEEWKGGSQITTLGGTIGTSYVKILMMRTKLKHPSRIRECILLVTD